MRVKLGKHIFAERNTEKQQTQGERGKEGGRPLKPPNENSTNNEKPLAARAAKGSSNGKRKKKQASRTSDQAASLVGLGSGDTLERVETALDVIDQLAEEGKSELAQTLVDLVISLKGLHRRLRLPRWNL